VKKHEIKGERHCAKVFVWLIFCRKEFEVSPETRRYLGTKAGD
jgi:hypothetical protein